MLFYLSLPLGRQSAPRRQIPLCVHNLEQVTMSSQVNPSSQPIINNGNISCHVLQPHLINIKRVNLLNYLCNLLCVCLLIKGRICFYTTKTTLIAHSSEVNTRMNIPVYLNIRDGRVQSARPVDQSSASVDKPFIMKSNKCLLHCSA